MCDVRRGARAAGFEPGRLCLAGESSIATDLVVRGLGVSPNSELGEAAGLAVGARGALVVDRRQRTTSPGVYAAGDCCESRHLVSGRQIHVALGTVANKQRRVAGTNLGGRYPPFPGLVGPALTKFCPPQVPRTGRTVREVQKSAGWVTGL